MIQKIQLFQSDSFDPYYNLAVEQYLLETVEKDTCILYLWQNSNTVVIGRNQNAWKECRTTLLEQEGGHLARRLSGGGAVFHDLGNLNFTFLVPTEDYDVNRQLSVICKACQDMGIPAEISGRNDLVAEGRKFSGNAFYQNGGRSYHHGTLLMHVDTEKMGRYLSPSKAKLEAKGVESVRSRVINLREYVPDLTCQQMEAHLATAFEEVYGLKAEILPPERLDQDVIGALRKRNGSREWLYGRKLPFTFSCEGRYEWGDIQLQLQVEGGLVQQVQAYSDAMDWSIAPQLEQILPGCVFSLDALQERIRTELSQSDVREDLCSMLAEQEI